VKHYDKEVIPKNLVSGLWRQYWRLGV